MFKKVTSTFSRPRFAIGNLIKPSSSAPVGIRTSNLLIRSQMLYPVELRAPEKSGNLRTNGGVVK
jgi:hypothetical protein